MSYASSEFWEAYEAYVDENIGRHRRAIGVIGGLQLPLLDLGCGRAREGQRICNAWTADTYYRGVDQISLPESPLFIQTDYRVLPVLKERLGDFRPRCALSLFSVELTAAPETNQAYYESLFEAFPSLDTILSAGFYYDDSRRHSATVHEAGGLESWQSIGPLAAGRMTERRLLERGPSMLFGPHVVEVWRRLARA